MRRHNRTIPKVLVFTTHPIQYQSPWFSAIERDRVADLHVCYSYLPDAEAQAVGFKEAFEWDIPLRTGFSNEVLLQRRLPIKSKFFSSLATNIRSRIAKHAPDAVLILGWQHASLLQASAISLVAGVPIILRGESNDKRARSSWISGIHRTYLRSASAFLAIGDSNAAFYRRLGAPAQRIKMARYFVDNDRFFTAAEAIRPRRGALRERWSIPADAFCVAFVGKFQQKKRVLDFVSAISIARRNGANVYGLAVGSGEQFDQAKELVVSEGVPVTFTGFLNQTEIPSAYVAADVLLMPSDFGETWGLACNEAMACGTPAIVSDRVGCAGDLVVNGETGGVGCFGAPSTYARYLEQWSRDDGKYRAIAAAARAHVTENYTISGANSALRAAIDVARSEK